MKLTETEKNFESGIRYTIRIILIMGLILIGFYMGKNDFIKTGFINKAYADSILGENATDSFSNGVSNINEWTAGVSASEFCLNSVASTSDYYISKITYGNLNRSNDSGYVSIRLNSSSPASNYTWLPQSPGWDSYDFNFTLPGSNYFKVQGGQCYTPEVYIQSLNATSQVAFWAKYYTVTGFLAGPHQETSSISFFKPTENLVTSDFENWVYSVTGWIESTSTYRSGIITEYNTPDENVFYDYIDTPEGGSLDEYNTSSSGLFYAYKRNKLVSNLHAVTSTATKWRAKGYLVDLGTLDNNELGYKILAETAWTNFYVKSGVTVAYPGAMPTSSVTSTYWRNPLYATTTNMDVCEPYASSTLGKTLCNVIKFTFYPHDMSTEFILTSYNDFKNVFPFNLFFFSTAIVEDSINSYDSSSPPTLNLDFKLPDSATSTIPILTPTLLQDKFGSTFVNWWYNIILMLVLVALLYEIYKLIFHST